MILRPATAAELDATLPLVAEFYADFGFPWDTARKRALLADLLARPDLGGLWLVQREGGVIGYALVAHYFSLEYDGRVALLDEFWITPAQRGAGLGGAVLEALEARLRADGVGVVRLEVEARHARASGLYARHGYEPGGREMWTKRL
ncbi:MAG: N-acetyltransferase family protein [Limisphaerales bacterium]